MLPARKAHVVNAHARRRNTYLACVDFNLTWDLSEVVKFDKLWAAGHGVEFIAKHFNRRIDEIVILIVDRANLGKIEPREGGVLGCPGPKGEKAMDASLGSALSVRR